MTNDFVLQFNRIQDLSNYESTINHIGSSEDNVFETNENKKMQIGQILNQEMIMPRQLDAWGFFWLLPGKL